MHILNIHLPPKKLEEILVAAANSVGWKAKVSNEHYNSQRLPINSYSWTDIYLRGAFLPAAKVTFSSDRVKEGEPPNSNVVVLNGLSYGVALRHEAEQYLKAVLQRIEMVERPGLM